MNYELYIAKAGDPATGYAPAFTTFKKRSDGSNVTPPAISEVGGGMYKFSYSAQEALCGVIDADPGNAHAMDAPDRYIPCVLKPMDGNLDAAISGRAASGEAAAAIAAYDPATGAEIAAVASDVTAVKGAVNAKLDAAVSTRAASGEAAAALALYDAATGSEVEALSDALTLVVGGLDNLDALVSTRATSADIAGAFGVGVLQSAVTVLDSDSQSIIRGDVKKITLGAGAGWNFTGKKVYFTAKADRTAGNEAAIADRECTVTDAVNGGAEITLTPDETAVAGQYYAEFSQTDSDGGNPMTIMQFTLRIVPDVRA